MRGRSDLVDHQVLVSPDVAGAVPDSDDAETPLVVPLGLLEFDHYRDTEGGGRTPVLDDQLVAAVERPEDIMKDVLGREGHFRAVEEL